MEFLYRVMEELGNAGVPIVFKGAMVLNMERKKVNYEVPEVGEKFKSGLADCEVMSIDNKAKDLNNSSIVIQMNYLGQSYLFMGDSEKENEKLRSWPQTNVLKVGHHGSDTSSGETFLTQVLPQLAIIQVGEGNSYGHPKQATLDKLKKIGTLVYRTDEKGNIVIESDGKKNKVSFY